VLALSALGFGAGSVAHAQEEDGTVAPQIFRWVDEDGVTHYTTRMDRVPRALRGRLGTRSAVPARTLSEPQPVASEAAPAPAAPTLAPTYEPVPSSYEPVPAPSYGAPTYPENPGAAASSDSAPAPSAAPAAAVLTPGLAPMAPAAGTPATAPTVTAKPAPTGDDRWVSENRAPEVPRYEPGSDASLGPEEGFTAAALSDDEAAALRARMEDLDLRIAEVSAEISADEDSIKEMISDPATAEAIDSGEDDAFLEISRRLPERLAELRTLRAERESLEGQL
jgi:hypothetical protein